MDDFNDSDGDMDEKQHQQLVENVLSLNKRPKFKKPTRTEPTGKVSEFNLVKSITGKQGVIHINDLTKALKKRAKHVEISKKVRSTERRAKTLPKPLEKPHAQRIKRNIAYEKVKKNLDRWDAIVTKNRGAHHLPFPIPSKLQLYTTGETSKEFNARNAEKKEYPLTMQEILERRQEIAKFRAVQSYKEAKSRRQSKIKSKKYHRIQRKEKIKNQIKEFEQLQKTNPEEALKKLDEIERARAEERASLRHHSTGKWAKSKQVRAKYDKDSRQVLAQQLSISRDLKQKVQNNKDSESDEDEHVTAATPIPDNSNNPWTNPQGSNEVIDFMDNYRKFWENINGTEKSSSAPRPNSVLTSVEGNLNIFDVNSKAQQSSEISSSVNDSTLNYKKENHVTQRDNKIVLENQMKKVAENESKLRRAIKSIPDKHNKLKQMAGVTENKNVLQKKKSKRVSDKQNQLNTIKTVINENRLEQKVVNEFEIPLRLKNKDVSGKMHTVKVKKLKQSKVMYLGTTEWAVGNLSDNESNSSITEPIDLDPIFDKFQKKIKMQLSEKYKNLKANLNTNNSLKSQPTKQQKIRKPKTKATAPVQDNNSAMDECFSEENENNKELNALKSILSSKEKAIDDINYTPIKTTAVNLNTDVPDLFTVEDNEENINQKGTIIEAFEDDDVVEEFHKEKEADIDKDKIDDIDLNLPGWGNWGGVGIKSSKRKNKRLIIKFPKEFKRRDDNKHDVLINEKANKKIKKHMVSEVPFPFRNVKDFEASVRAPIGETFVPELAFKKMIKPAVTTKMGTIIEPMSEDILID